MKMHAIGARVGVVVLLLAVGACGVGETGSHGKFKAGLTFSDEATAADVGLPTYPGSKLFQDSGDSSPAANVGLSTSLFGFKIVAVKFETPDAPERVATFYRQALSKFGSVLECGSAADGKRQPRSESGELACENDECETRCIMYKVGTRKNQRIVAIEPRGNGTRFNLVHVDVR